ncbi:MAG: GGDEF domain-containing protein [Hydrogenophilaceae bacterium]|nr:GGDEF domain-containing protein [Hydrogenophilaceae bacterium]
MPEQLLGRLPLLGLLVAALFWVLDAIIDVSLFGTHDTFSDALLNPNPHELWMRCVVIVLLLVFAWHARRLGNKLVDSMDLLKEQEHELGNHRDMHHVLKRQTDELARKVMREASEKEELRKLAYLDPLTGLYNRRRIEEILDASRMTERLSHNGLCVLLCDIDHFKSVNDQFGHFAGDRVLVRIGQLLKDHFRRGDAVGRWGGEEFLVVLPNLTQAEAEVISENFRARVEREYHPPKGKLTVSLGLAMLKPDELTESLLKRADRALMLAKQNGRNRMYICECVNESKEPAVQHDCKPFELASQRI